jgi:hypothetical protein
MDDSSRRALVTHSIRFSAVALALVFMSASFAAALPDYAAEENKPCSYCHVDPAGSGPRNARGQYYEAHDFSFAGFAEEASAGAATSPMQALMNALAFSGKMRMVYSVAEGPHGTISSNCESCHASGERAPDQSFFVMQGELAVSAQVSERVSFVYSNDLGITRDLFGVIRLGDRGFVKAGSFEVPYGLDEMRDHNALVKARHNVGSNVRDAGVQVGVHSGKGFGTVAVLNGGRRGSESSPVLLEGIDQDGTPAVVARAGIRTPRVMLGASVLHDNSARGLQPRETFAGVFGTVNAGRFRASGEIDFGEERSGPEAVSNFGFFAQGTAQVHERLDVSARIDHYDPDTGFADAETWYSLIAEHRLARNASLQGRARIRDEEAEDSGEAPSFGTYDNDDAMLILYLHF